MSAALELAVTRRIGEFSLDVAFEVQSGVAVLFGPSGSGKSLTLALIAGLVRPDTGTIAINGVVLTDCATRRYATPQARRLGVAFQDGLLLPHRSVLDNVALAVRQRRTRRERRELAATWLERVGAADLARRQPGTLSGGQRQRVALARCLAGDPQLVLLDEPLSALDSTVRAELRELVRDVLVASRVPALLVTHDAEEADQLGDVVIEYRDGRVSGRRAVEGRVGPPDATGSHDPSPS